MQLYRPPPLRATQGLNNSTSRPVSYGSSNSTLGSVSCNSSSGNSSRSVPTSKWWKAADAKQQKTFDGYKDDIKTYLTICSQGVPAKKAYKTFAVDGEIKYRDLGFQNFGEFLYHCDDILEVRKDKKTRSDLFIFFRGRADEDMGHLRELVLVENSRGPATLRNTFSVDSSNLLQAFRRPGPDSSNAMSTLSSTTRTSSLRSGFSNSYIGSRGRGRGYGGVSRGGRSRGGSTRSNSRSANDILTISGVPALKPYFEPKNDQTRAPSKVVSTNMDSEDEDDFVTQEIWSASDDKNNDGDADFEVPEYFSDEDDMPDGSSLNDKSNVNAGFVQNGGESHNLNRADCIPYSKASSPTPGVSISTQFSPEKRSQDRNISQHSTNRGSYLPSPDERSQMREAGISFLLSVPNEEATVSSKAIPSRVQSSVSSNTEHIMKFATLELETALELPTNTLRPRNTDVALDNNVSNSISSSSKKCTNIESTEFIPANASGVRGVPTPAAANLRSKPLLKVQAQGNVPWYQMKMPADGAFRAKLLGVDGFGLFFIQLNNPAIEKGFEDLQKSISDFYSEERLNAYRMDPAEMRCGLMAVANIQGEFVRANIYETDLKNNFCILTDLEYHDFHIVGLKDIYMIDKSFQSRRPRAIMCTLEGLEQHVMTQEITDAFEAIVVSFRWTDLKVIVKGSMFGVPCVSMTLEDDTDVAELIKLHGGQFLNTPYDKDSWKNIQDAQLEILKRKNYFPSN